MRRVLTRLQAKRAPFEAYCIAAKIPVKKTFGIIAAEVCDQEQKAEQLLLAAHHNEIVEKTFQMAMKDTDGRDRRMLRQAAGFLPVPIHALSFISANVDVHTQTNNVAVSPPIESSIKRWSDRFNAIAPPTPTPVELPPELAPIEEPDEEEPDEEEEPETPDDNQPDDYMGDNE